MILNKIKHNQFGLTLVELLATLVLSSIIVIFATSIFVKGTEHYQTISTENALRDEADLIMVKMYKELYTTKSSEIESFKVQDNYSYFIYKKKPLDDVTTPQKILGYKDDKLYFKDGEYTISNSNIQLDINASSIEETSKGVYTIKLVLYMKDKNKTMEFVNEVSIINDAEDETT